MLNSIKLRYGVVLFALAGWWAVHPAQGIAEEASTVELPITRVVLFNCGVGFFEHDGEIDGTQRVDLKFGVEEVNDLLKSLVLQDLGGGQVSAVTYDSREPLVRTLKTFTLDLTSSPTLADLLQQARGERIRIEAPQSIEGVILGVEVRKVAEGDAVVEKQFLNLKTDKGLRSVPMDRIVECRFLNKKLDAELNEALSLLAAARATDKKTVALEFRGNGKRDVRVGYIQETPVWKASYRLVLDDEKPPFLQGWAIVENTGDQDWEDVKLSLVSGRPISFIMDLYEPLYVARPTVVPEQFAGLVPRVHDQDLTLRLEDLAVRQDLTVRDQRGRGVSGGAFGGDFASTPRLDEAMPESESSGEAGAKQATLFDLAQGVANAAAAGDVGELFRYDIKSPVTLARRKSAMLPIVNAPVKGEKVSIYNPSGQPKHPFNGVQLTNSTDLHLLQGPITVFDGGEFAGDARMEDVPPGGKRLISYAIDSDVEVSPEASPKPDELVSVSIAKGVLKLQHKKTRRQKYVIKNSSGQPKTVLVEQPILAGWHLVSPKEPAEKTRDLYRFKVEVEPDKSSTLAVEEQQQAGQNMYLAKMNSKAVLSLAASTGAVNPAVEKALQQFAEMKTALDSIAAERHRAETGINAIDEEQARIRLNMPQLDRNSALYGRYIKKLAEQEDEIEQLRKQLAELRDQETKQREALEQFVLGLEVE